MATGIDALNDASDRTVIKIHRDVTETVRQVPDPSRRYDPLDMAFDAYERGQRNAASVPAQSRSDFGTAAKAAVLVIIAIVVLLAGIIVWQNWPPTLDMFTGPSACPGSQATYDHTARKYIWNC